jgi:hypothetical protein
MIRMRSPIVILGLVLLALFVATGVHLLSFGQAATGAGLSLAVFGTVQTDSDLVRMLIAWGLADASGGIKKMRVIAQTANYAVLSPVTSAAGDASGTLFTNRGAAGAVTFTLPAVVAAMYGVYYDFVGVANQTFGVAAAAGAVVTFNNAAATSVTCSTGGAKIGAKIRAVCDGTSWILIGDTVGVTYTVA